MNISALVFDMVGVLFTVDKKIGLKHVGFTALLAYCLRNKSNPFDQGMLILDKMRKEVPGEFQDKLTYKGTLMPLCITEWQRGLLTSNHVMAQLLVYLEELDEKNYFIHKHDKAIIAKILQLMLDPEYAHAVLKPIPSSLRLIEELKAKYPLYLLSNINHEIMVPLQLRFCDFFEQFNGIITSCTTQLLKPDPEIFTYLLKKHELETSATCFIDDQLENILTAQKMGLKTIHCHNPKKLGQNLLNLGITITK